jgi:HK97 family phage portal protein
MFESLRDWLLGPSKKSIASHEMASLIYNSGVQTASGQLVSSDTAMRVTTVFAAVRLLASSVGRLPLNLYREQGETRVLLPDHPIAQMLRWKPNNWQTAFEFQSMMMGHLALRGNAYARIIRIGTRPAALIPMHPNYVTVEQRADGSLIYRGHGILGETLTLEQRDVLHLRGMSSYGVVGINPIAAARNAIGMALAVDEYGSTMFANGATPSGVLKKDGALSEEAITRLRAQFEEKFAGSANAGRPLILEEGMSWQAISMSAEDSQFLETRKFNRTEIASLFNIPPHMLGDLERATFTNIEHQSLDFVRNCLEAWLECWEQAIKRDLLWGLEGNGLVVDFDTTKLTQGDFQSLMTSFQLAINNGVMNPNEARRMLGMNPRDGGDDYRMTPNSLPEGALPDAA